MGKFSSAFRTTSAPTATLPGASIYAPAGNGGLLKQVTVTNTTTTGFMVAIRELTTAGTQGANETEKEWHEDGAAPTLTAVNSHTVGPTIAAGDYGRASIGAAIGAGFVFKFDKGIWIPAGVANGVGILTPSGTGQVADVEFVWEE